MSDIEIEEHDVFDDPIIRRIFPDLSVIKKEISQYEEGLNTFLEIPPQTAAEVVDRTLDEDATIQKIINSVTDAPTDLKSQECSQQASGDNRFEIRQRFKTFLDSLADDTSEITDITDTLSGASYKYSEDCLSSSPLNCSKSVDSPNKNIKQITNNIFILGSKPSLKHAKNLRQKKELKIVLKNVSPYLNGCKQYCKNCLILFPNVSALKCHISKMHSSKKSNKKNHVALKSSEIKFQCNICTINLSSKYNLIRHLKMVHKKKETNKSVDMICVTTPMRRKRRNHKHQVLNRDIKPCGIKLPLKAFTKSRSSKITESHKCFHCTKIFENRNSLIEHLYDVINPNKIVSNNSESEQTSINLSSVTGQDKDADKLPVSTKIECSLCAIKFTTQKLLDQHNRVSHINNEINDVNQKSNSAEVSNESKKTESIITGSVDTINENGVDITKTKMLSDENNDTDFESDNRIAPDDNSGFNSASDSEKNINESLITPHRKKKMYQCFICSQYIFFYKNFSQHMAIHHNIKEIPRDKTVFESQCKLCPFKFHNVKSYNDHVLMCHTDLSTMKIKMNRIAFYSVLFKCVKCDMFFLSSNVAMCHSKHEELANNWRCLECQRLFKLEDKPLHLRQHLLSENITAYALTDSALKRTLFKCLKCAVHFSEEEYFLHYTTCDLQIPDSTYCIICDILINRNDMILHERNHKKENVQSCDFTFIESEIITIDNVEKINLHAGSKFALTYCQTCACFLGEMGSQRKIHIEKRCKTLNSRLCHQCGLVLTPKGYLSHEKLHRKVKNLNLQAFYFYHMKSKKQIPPPIPIYPKCKICEVHFLNKIAIKGHKCEKQDYIKCNVCKIKLTEAAFKLHISFHNYKLSSYMLHENQKTRLSIKKNVTKSTSGISSNSSKNILPKNQNSYISKKSNKQETKILYTCICCNITVNSYDEVVVHCHDHYDCSKELQTIEDKTKYPSDDKSTLSLKYDPFYFRFGNDFWYNHIFVNATKHKINNILENSIYKFERRLKMEVIQSGSETASSVLYKCGICRTYIDPNELFVHASNNCARQAHKHTCSQCGLCFNSSNYQLLHEKLFHARRGFDIANNEIILFNKMEDQQFTNTMLESPNKFILYQCRGCEGIVDKLQRKNHQCQNAELLKCSSCGLLIYRNEFHLHYSKHSLVINYKSENIDVVLFGKLESQGDKKIKPSFKGTIYDLTFYKCVHCEICFYKSKNNKNKHVCFSDSSQCLKCGMTFSNEDLHEHTKLHENTLQLGSQDFNSNIITFDSSIVKVYRNTKKVQVNNVIHKKSKSENVTKEIEYLDVTDKMYKCNCGLHFLEESNARTHQNTCNPKTKMSKQSCFKCHMLFTPGELFNHLLKHHGGKKIKYSYDIINVSE